MRMKHLLPGLILLTASGGALAEADYYRLELEITIDRPAAEVWARIGGYCDIGEWLERECAITQGDGGIGTVRVLNGTLVEPMVAKTDLSYAYTQPVVEGQYYTLYHGQMEAQPVTADTTRLVYTMMWDISQSSEEAFAAAVERRRKLFTAALARMKEIAEAGQ